MTAPSCFLEVREHLTSVEFSRLLEEQNQRKTLKAAEKAHRKEIGEANKAAKAAVDAEWKREHRA